MIECPNCSKKLNENFTYCYICGCEIRSENMGDFKTNLLNVFHIDDEFLYLFSVKGKQVILKADSIEELQHLVWLNRFPWKEISQNVQHD